MAQRKELTFAELRVGLFVLAGLFLIALGIFYITGGGILAPKIRLITYLPEVENLQPGAPVQLDGITIGSLQSIALTPHPVDSMHNITLVLRVDKKYESDIRTDSTVSLMTEGLLGDRAVEISRGLTGAVIQPNGIVHGKEEVAMKQMVEHGAALMQNLGALSEDLRSIVNQVHEGNGTLAKLMNDSSLYDHLNATAAKFDTMASSIKRGQGTLGKLVASDDLYSQANDTLGDARNVFEAVVQQKGTVGKLIYDPAVYDGAKGLVQNGNALLSDVRAGKGSLGKLANDDVLYTNLRDASANIRNATTKLNSNQGTIGKFFNDPEFYDNMTALSGDLRLMVNDFRQNPKKFLHVKFGVF